MEGDSNLPVDPAASQKVVNKTPEQKANLCGLNDIVWKNSWR